jgi:NAD(P)H dehydrogenase (quinone)
VSTPTVLVFGATGNVGSAVIRELLPDHREGRLKLIAAVRRAETAAGFGQQGIETRLIDLDRAEMEGLAPVVEATHGADRLFLLTGYDVKMLAQSKAVVDAAKTVGVSHIVHMGANGRSDTTSAHLGWHRLVEVYIERSGIGFTHLRPSQFMQTLPMLHAMSGRSGVIQSYAGDARVGWIDITDIAAVAGAALRNPASHVGETYPLASDLGSMHEVVALLSDVTGRPWRYDAREPEEFFKKMTSAGIDAVYMKGVQNGFVRTRDGSLPELCEVYDNIQSLTGRAPTSLRTFVERNRSAFEISPAQSPS